MYDAKILPCTIDRIMYINWPLSTPSLVKKNYINMKFKMERGTYVSSHAKQWTKIGRMPDCINSSMGGLRSLDNNFLKNKNDNFS